MEKTEKVLLFVLLMLFIAVLVAIGQDATAAPAPLAPPFVQAGTAVIHPGGGTIGMVDIAYNFPAPPVIVATLSDQVPVKYVYARAFSGTRGAIVIELDAPADYPIQVNWMATMATDAAVTEGVSR